MSEEYKNRWYGRRNGKRLSARRKYLIANLLPQFSLSLESLMDCDPLLELFAHDQDEVWLEIGFGAGEHIAKQALLNPKIGFIGCEPFINGVANLLSLIDEDRLTNILIYNDDSGPFLNFVPDGSIGRIFLLFPDPWPKKKHHKRRLVSQESLRQFSRILADGGEFRFASDHVEYADWVAHNFSECQDFYKISKKILENDDRPDGWISTRYEHKAVQRGENIIYFQFGRCERL